jgi:hypothetical protein
MNYRIRAAAVAALVVLALPSSVARAQQNIALPCARTDKACALKAAKAHPVRKVGFWAAALAKPVGERLGPAPPGLVQYLHLDNIFNGFPNQPRASELAEDFLEDVRGAIADMPPAVRKVFGSTFAGVYFVEDLGGTGYTDMFYEGKDRPMGGYIVLDSAVLGKLTANAWATWKENTPFKPQPEWKLDALIETSAGDNRRNAIQYILLHELGHVLSINRNIHPRWDIPPKSVPADARFPFFELAWWIDRSEDRYGSKFEDKFPQRRSVVYYLGAKLAATEMVTTYGNLEKTNYPTLYAATSPGDDFAEAFASYVHTVLMKRPWEIRILHDGKVAKTYESCWEEPRCAAKRRILEDLIR